MTPKSIVKSMIVAVALAAAVPALAQSSHRAGRSEIYLSPQFTDSKDYTFADGSTVRADTGFGLLFGYNYNFNAHTQAGIEFGWTDADYRATVAPGPGNTNPPGSYSSTLESWTVRFTGTYNFLDANFTPFVTGGLGWTSIDSNIPSGLPESICWAYPWYGMYCSTYVPTHSTTKFSYNAGAGLRLDVGQGVFRAVVNQQWVDFGGSYGSSNVLQYRIDFGVKF